MSNETFPDISRKPSEVFSDEPPDEAVLVADLASGYPHLNKLFTFSPRTFNFEMPCVPEADKLWIMEFYENNKEVPFYWLNKQDKMVYEVVFLSKPKCRLESDGCGDLWRISMSLRQASSYRQASS